MKFPSTSSTLDDPAIDRAFIQQAQQSSTQLPDAKTQTILEELDPLTYPTYDSKGNIIQIWQYRSIFLGAILDKNGHVTTILNCIRKKTTKQ